MSKITTPATRNEDWGFWGTMGCHASIVWPLAMRAIADATGEDLENIRAFLDSRYGRHYADEVQNGLYVGKPLKDAIDTATQKWMSRTIGSRTSFDYGIPRGMAYLTGFVAHCAINDEQETA